MRIGIIDSGISKQISIKSKIEYACNIFEKQGYLYMDYNIEDKIGHGTNVITLIDTLSKFNTYVVVKIFDENLVSTYDAFIEAIKICIEKKVDIINLSLSFFGKTTDFCEVNELLKDARRKDIMIITSIPNDLRNTFLNESEYLISVRGHLLKNPSTFYFEKNKCIVDDTPIFVRGKNNKINLFGKNNSMACAKFTAIVANILKKNKIEDYNDLENFTPFKKNEKIFLERQREYTTIKTRNDDIFNEILDFIKKNKMINDESIILENSLFSEKIGYNYIDICEFMNFLEIFYKINIDYSKLDYYNVFSIYDLCELIRRYKYE